MSVGRHRQRCAPQSLAAHELAGLGLGDAAMWMLHHKKNPGQRDVAPLHDAANAHREQLAAGVAVKPARTVRFAGERLHVV